MKRNQQLFLLNMAKLLSYISITILLASCSKNTDDESRHVQENSVTAMKTSALFKQTETTNPLRLHHRQGQGKPVIYQVFTRLFGNVNTTNKAWGTIDENGVGKFADFTDKALAGIKELGTSYVWYTGVPHHAVINDYTAYGISLDDPDVVKGRAGSPYAVKDYYNVNPDLAIDPAKRMSEFEALIARTHKHDMKVLIDIVPNHVARQYESISLPEGQQNFGEEDNVNAEYAKHNNFYYIQGASFSVPDSIKAYQPLGGAAHPLADGIFDETPAKWTGNGSRDAKPSANDWYETVKVNYGVRPDGSYDFPSLPHEFKDLPHAQHYAFWQQQKDLPDSWYKFEAIAHYWLDKGVDGFRYDMAEMVPVEFWSYLNSSIKAKHPDALLLAEVYNPSLYRDYLQLGKMDYLYDKVAFYDNLKWLMQGKGEAQALEAIQTDLADIEQHMLHFLENHDEQRIASPEFVGSAEKGKPAMLVSALISRSPTMLYFGQDVGEDGSEEPGFGASSRTSIFDYVGVPAHQRWMNYGEFDGALLSESERTLRQFYINIMNISAHHRAMQGQYMSLHSMNIAFAQDATDSNYTQNLFSFIRYTQDNALIVVANFSQENRSIKLKLPSKWLLDMGVTDASINVIDLISEQQNKIYYDGEGAYINIKLAPLGSFVYELDTSNN